MREILTEVVVSFKNADGDDVVLKYESPINNAHIAYQDLLALKAKLLGLADE
jgi:hypothetical protein